MELQNVVQTLTYVVTYITPFAFLWAIIYRIYNFIMSAVTGGHKFM